MAKPQANVYVYITVSLVASDSEGEQHRFAGQASGNVDSNTGLLPEDSLITSIAKAYADAAISLASLGYWKMLQEQSLKVKLDSNDIFIPSDDQGPPFTHLEVIDDEEDGEARNLGIKLEDVR